MKKYIVVRNACEGVTRSSLGDVDAQSTPSNEILARENTSAPDEDAGQDRVDN